MMTKETIAFALDSLMWRELGFALSDGHRPRVRRTFALDGGPVAVRVTGLSSAGFAFVEACAAHHVAVAPIGAVALDRLVTLKEWERKGYTGPTANTDISERRG